MSMVFNRVPIYSCKNFQRNLLRGFCGNSVCIICLWIRCGICTGSVDCVDTVASMESMECMDSSLQNPHKFHT